MPLDAWITLGLLAFGLFIVASKPFRTARKAPVTRISSRPIVTSKPPPKPAQPFLPLLAKLIARDLARVRNAWHVGVDMWHAETARLKSNMSSAHTPVSQKTLPPPPLLENLSAENKNAEKEKTENKNWEIPIEEIVTIVLALQDDGKKRKKTETLVSLPSYRSRDHKLFADVWDRAAAAVQESKRQVITTEEEAMNENH